jgi:transposase
MTMTNDQENWVGVDVSKARLDVYESGTDLDATYPNDEPGIAGLVSALGQTRPRLVVLEATGGLERALVAQLLAATLPVAVVNPRQVRDFAKALGQRAKTDRLDARVLAHFARAIQPTQRALPDAAALDFADQLARRRQLVEMLSMEKTRLKQSTHKEVRHDLKKHIVWLENRLRATEGGCVRRWNNRLPGKPSEIC